MQRWWSAKPKSQSLGHTQPSQPAVSQRQAQRQPGPPAQPWWPRHSARGTECLAEPRMPSSHLGGGGNVVTSPRGSGLGPIPSPASRQAATGQWEAVTTSGSGEELAKLYPSSPRGGEAAGLLCPRESGHHTPWQWALAGAKEPFQEKQRADSTGGRLSARLVSP